MLNNFWLLVEAKFPHCCYGKLLSACKIGLLGLLWEQSMQLKACLTNIPPPFVFYYPVNNIIKKLNLLCFWSPRNTKQKILYHFTLLTSSLNWKLFYPEFILSHKIFLSQKYLFYPTCLRFLFSVVCLHVSVSNSASSCSTTACVWYFSCVSVSNSSAPSCSDRLVSHENKILIQKIYCVRK